ncbi:glycosyltransferase [Geomonas agri]|uniref:glycosyltransferase n=1 Tax=Geomonas agri TaxID=2873702 RepID=UPI001CD496B4|nr:glycosyltransferase [Geomonas agri]
MKKIGIVSHVLPPSPSGQSMVLHRLLSPIGPESYCLISSGPKHDTGEAACAPLDADYFYLPKTRLLPPVGLPWLSALFVCINLLWVVWRRSRHIEDVARREQCEALVACTGEFYDLPAAFLACKRLNIPFIAYVFDDYAYQWLGVRRSIAKRLERILLSAAAAVIVPNEYLQKEYGARHGIGCTVIHNPCDLPDLEKLDSGPKAFGEGVSIVYTGAIYHAHYDAFANLIDALRVLRRHDVKLHLFTAQSEQELAEHGIAGPHVVHHPHVPQREVARILRQADILFLPLAFHSPIPEVIRTSAPGKTGEYLAVGRPVLVHALPDSFIAWYFRDNDCGVVVDRHDAKMLAGAIEALVSNPQRMAELGLKARRRAQIDFDVVGARSQFIAVLRDAGSRGTA